MKKFRRQFCKKNNGKHCLCRTSNLVPFIVRIQMSRIVEFDTFIKWETEAFKHLFNAFGHRTNVTHF
jgi:hypothetical protein